METTASRCLTLALAFVGLLGVAAPSARAAMQLYATLGNGNVDSLSANGTATAYATGFTQPEGLAFDGAGNLYVADRQAGTVTKTTPAGVRTTLYTTQGILNGVTTDPAGNVYAAIDGGVVKITPAGTVSTFGPNTNSTGLAFDAAGDLFVASAQNSIYKIPAGSTTGTVFASGGGLSTPFALAINPAGTLLYAANADGNSILKFPLTGGAGSVFSTTGLNVPIGLAFDAAGNLYVGNRGTGTNGTIEKFDPSGNASVFATGLGDVEYLAFGPVPEPGTWALLGVGSVAGLGLALRRRRTVV